MTVDLAQPIYPWFGSKRRIASVIWEAFGEVDNFIDPFLGTCSVLLSAPWPANRTETVNDKDAFLANVWRAIKYNPEAVAEYADWPVNEADLEARHAWLVSEGRKRLAALMPDPHGYDAEIAGWWLWGQCCWIGSGWCSGDGPWVVGENGWESLRNAGKGVNRNLPHLGNAGKGVNRNLPHLGNAGKAHSEHLIEQFSALAERLRYVRVCCGDWTRVLTPSVTFKHGTTAIVLDPPYANKANRTGGLYTEDCGKLSHEVREWAIANGGNPLLRIVLCGYEGEHEMPDAWRVHQWSATGGYSGFAKKAKNGKVNKHRERLWFSPHCDSKLQRELF